MRDPHKLKALIRQWVPPGFIRLAMVALDHLRPAPWEYVPAGWRQELMRGWDVNSVVERQMECWRAYQECLQGPSPLGLNHEALLQPDTGDFRDHNTLVSFAYVLALAAHEKRRLSILDWGGGIGHYYLLSKAVLPGVELDYACRDLPRQCEAGRQLLPNVEFRETSNETFSRHYDLVLASSSLWYEKDWQSLVARLASIADPYLYITRLVFIEHASSYVAIQRPWRLGYSTEYLCWILNRKEFLTHLDACGMELLREFLICDGPYIYRAPEQGDYRGFLFRKRRPTGG